MRDGLVVLHGYVVLVDEVRTLLVFGEKNFRIKVPMDYKITFGPFSPPTTNNRGYRQPGDSVGTLRIYDRNKERTVAVFSNVSGYRDTSFDYAEEVAVEEGARIWKSDQHGYSREENIKVQREWVADLPELNPPDSPF